MMRALRLWKDGPLAHTQAEVLVSVTDFTATHWRDLPRIYWQALRLRRGWPRMRGAVGLWLWTKPLQKRSGSVSVWRDEADLAAFVGTPYHVAVMRRNRGRGRLVAHTRREPAYSRQAVWERAARQLAHPPPARATGPDRPARRWISQEIARLDPVSDASRITRLSLNRWLPRRGAHAALNLAYCLGLMHLSGQLDGAQAIDRAGSGEVHRGPDRRADATITYLLRWMQHGPNTEAGAAAIAPVARMHAHYAREYPMSSDTLVHTICYFAVQLDHLYRLVGGPGLSAHERTASLVHWTLVGRCLGVDGVPATWDDAERFVRRYEASADRFGYTSSARRCAEALIDQFTSRWLPPGARRAGRTLLLSLHEDHVLAALGLPAPARPTRRAVRAVLRATLYLRRTLLPDRATLFDSEDLGRGRSPVG